MNVRFCLNVIISACVASASFHYYVDNTPNGGYWNGFFVAPYWGYFPYPFPNVHQPYPHLPLPGNQPSTQPIIEDMDAEAGSDVTAPSTNKQEDDSDSHAMKPFELDAKKLMDLFNNPRAPSPSGVLNWLLTMLATQVLVSILPNRFPFLQSQNDVYQNQARGFALCLSSGIAVCRKRPNWLRTLMISHAVYAMVPALLMPGFQDVLNIAVGYVMYGLANDYEGGWLKIAAYMLVMFFRNLDLFKRF